MARISKYAAPGIIAAFYIGISTSAIGQTPAWQPVVLANQQLVEPSDVGWRTGGLLTISTRCLADDGTVLIPTALRQFNNSNYSTGLVRSSSTGLRGFAISATEGPDGFPIQDWSNVHVLYRSSSRERHILAGGFMSTLYRFGSLGDEALMRFPGYVRGLPEIIPIAEHANQFSCSMNREGVVAAVIPDSAHAVARDHIVRFGATSSHDIAVTNSYVQPGFQYLYWPTINDNGVIAFVATDLVPPQTLIDHILVEYPDGLVQVAVNEGDSIENMPGFTISAINPYQVGINNSDVLVFVGHLAGPDLTPATNEGLFMWSPASQGHASTLRLILREGQEVAPDRYVSFLREDLGYQPDFDRPTVVISDGGFVCAQVQTWDANGLITGNVILRQSPTGEWLTIASRTGGRILRNGSVNSRGQVLYFERITDRSANNIFGADVAGVSHLMHPANRHGYFTEAYFERPSGGSDGLQGLLNEEGDILIQWANSIFLARIPNSCDSIDFNNDGSTHDPVDIDAFLNVYSEGPCVPSDAVCNDIDFNNDGSLFDPEDIVSFLRVYSEGPC